MSKLKCWKKVEENWYATKDFDSRSSLKGTHIMIEKQGFPPYVNHVVWIGSRMGKTTKESKSFDTEKQAKAFAQNYMKDHDRC